MEICKGDPPSQYVLCKISFPNSNATFELTSSLLYRMDFFHLLARRITVRVDHHTHSLLISNTYSYFVHVLDDFTNSNRVFSGYSSSFVTLQGKTYIFCQNFTPYFSFPFHYCQLPCGLEWASKQSSTYNVSIVFLVETLKEISREGNHLNNYLSVQEDLFVDAEVSYSKVNKVRGDLLNQYATLEVGLLIALIIRTLFS